MKPQALQSDVSYSPGMPPEVIDHQERLAMDRWWQEVVRSYARPVWPSVVMRHHHPYPGTVLFRVSGMCYRPQVSA